MERWKESSCLREIDDLKAAHPVVFIGCGKQKRQGSHPVAVLYTGQYFRFCLRVARRLTDEQSIFVLSAKYGPVELDQVIETYDLKLSDLNKDQITEWRGRVREFVEGWVDRRRAIVLVCGQLYSEGLPGLRLLPVVGIGEQMSFMKQLLAPKGFLP